MGWAIRVQNWDGVGPQDPNLGWLDQIMNLISNVLYFKDIHDVEFEVRTGPFPGDNQRCKLTCVKGQWVGPLCRTKESKKPLHTVWTVKSVQRMYTRYLLVFFDCLPHPNLSVTFTKVI